MFFNKRFYSSSLGGLNRKLTAEKSQFISKCIKWFPIDNDKIKNY